MSNYLVITGGSGGIGTATATIFAEHGWKIINLSRTPCLVPNAKNYKIDLSEPANLEKIANDLRNDLASATKICLVQNAGHQVTDTIENVTAEDIYHTLNVNVISSSQLNRIVVPLMKPGSSVIYLGSMLAERGVPGNASYILSKHAVLGLMRSTCQDLVGRDIHTCCVCPGLVETKLLRASMSDELINHLLKTYVVGGRVIMPQEIGELIYNCAHMPVVNGSIVSANLGLVASA